MIQNRWTLNFCDSLIAVNASHKHIAKQARLTDRIIVSTVDQVESTIDVSAHWGFLCEGIFNFG